MLLQKEKMCKGTNCKCRKNALACGPLCRCESCSNSNKDELEEEDNEDANESNDSSGDEKDEEILEDADEIVTFMNLKLKMPTKMLGSWIWLLSHKYSCMNISIKRINENSMSARNTE